MYNTKKYKRIIKGIFPDREGGEIQMSAVQKLLSYSQINPHTLPSIAKHLDKKIHEFLRHRPTDGSPGVAMVSMSMTALRELITGSRDTPQISDVVLRLISELAEYPSVETRLSSCRTFCAFVSSLSGVGLGGGGGAGGSGSSTTVSTATDFDALASRFVSFTSVTTSAALAAPQSLVETLRREAVAAMKSFVALLELRDDLDDFIDRRSAPFLRGLLDLVIAEAPHPPVEPPPPAGQETIGQAGERCLVDLVERINVFSIGKLMTTVLRYCDERKAWSVEGPGAEGRECAAMRVLAPIKRGLKSNARSMVATSLLAHLESTPAPPATGGVQVSAADAQRASKVRTIAVLDCVSRLFDDTAGDLGTVLVSLVKCLRDPSVDDDVHDAVLSAVSTVCAKSSNSPQKLDAVGKACDILLLEGGSYLSLLQVAHAILRHTAKPASSRKVNSVLESLVEKVLCPVASSRKTSSLEERDLALSLLLVVASDGAWGALADFLSGVKPSPDAVVEEIGVAKDADGLLASKATLIRSTVLGLLTRPPRKLLPGHLVLCYNVLLSLLLRLRNAEIATTVPLLFRLEESLHAAPHPLNLAVHLLIGCYLEAIAAVNGRPKLAEHISASLAAAKAAKLAPSELSWKHGLVSASKDRWLKRSKERGASPLDPSLAYDRELIVEALCSIQSLTQQCPNLAHLLSPASGASPLVAPAAAVPQTADASAPTVVPTNRSKADLYKDIVAHMATVPRSAAVTATVAAESTAQAGAGAPSGSALVTYADVARAFSGQSVATPAAPTAAATPVAPLAGIVVIGTVVNQPAAAAQPPVVVTVSRVPFERRVDMCSGAACQRRKAFDHVMSFVPKPDAVSTDLLCYHTGAGPRGSVAWRQVEPQATSAEPDWDHFVAARQHWPALFPALD